MLKTTNFYKEQNDHFRAILLKRLEDLLSRAEKTVSSLMAPQEKEIDFLDQASAYYDQAFNLRIRGREQKLIKKINNALSRIEKGTYGICELCGEPISIKRLTARPVTTKCIKCKTSEEAEERLTG